jgi:hypothetical protein
MRRVGPAVEAVIEKEVRDMLDRGWIRPSESPWSSRLVLVPKPDGTIRTCVDFRRVNELTVTDAYPSPMVEDVIDCLSGAIFFTTFDAEKGYYQLLMDEQSIPITAFSCHLGLFEFIRMAFGLKNAGAFFQRMMDNTFSDFIRKFLKQFVDDTLIYSKSFDEHLIHIGLVLDRMRSIHITAKLSKCTFAAPSIKFVGFIISADGRRKDPEKISAISNILPPRTKKELRQFLGFTGYLRIFIKGYAQIARPLMLLTRDEVKNEEVEKRWTTDHQVAFDQLKKSVTEDVVLAHPDYSQPFIIETDASDFAVGVVIGQMHEDTVHNRSIIRPIAFGSAALTTAQQRYTATEREGLAVVYAVDRFRSYIMGSKAIVITDHTALVHIFSSQNPSNRLYRWSVLLSEFNLEFKHRSGALHVVPDALSRLPAIDQPTIPDAMAKWPNAINQVMVESQPISTPASTLIGNPLIVDQWRIAQENDPLLSSIIAFIRDGTTNADTKSFAWTVYRMHQFMMRNSLLHWVETLHRVKPAVTVVVVAVPESMIQRVLAHMHDEPSIGAHMSINKTIGRLRQNFWWKSMYHDLEVYVANCRVCQANASSSRPLLPLQPNIEATRKMEVLSIDALALPAIPSFPSHCLVVMDHATRFAWAMPVPNLQATSIITAIKTHVVGVFGWPEILLSDNGTEFKNALLNEMCALMGTERRFTTAYHPQTNGLVERTNRTIIELLSKAARVSTDWISQLPDIVTAYNNAPLQDGGRSPFQLMFGRTCTLPLARNLGVTCPTTDEDNDAAIAETVDARRNRLSHQRDRVNADRTQPISFPIGQLVWKLDNAVVTSSKHNRNVKLDANWQGMFVVTESKSDSVIRVRPLGSSDILSVNAGQLKPYLLQGRPVSMHADQIHRSMPLDTPENPAVADTRRHSSRLQQKKSRQDDVEEVLRVIDFKILKSGYVSFLLVWHNGEEGWEPEENLQCQFLIREFFASKAPAATRLVQSS